MMIINEFLLKRSIETRYYPIVEFKMVLRQLDKGIFENDYDENSPWND